MKYWLMKSEPNECSIDYLATLPDQTIEWFGIRNYLARNYMRDHMVRGDRALFWHSSCANPGVYGEVEVVTQHAHPDSLQFDIDSEYYEPKSTIDNPRWWCVDMRLVKKVQYISIASLRQYPELSQMKVLQKGNRLSITPVTKEEWDFIQTLMVTAQPIK